MNVTDKTSTTTIKVLSVFIIEPLNKNVLNLEGAVNKNRTVDSVCNSCVTVESEKEMGSPIIYFVKATSRRYPMLPAAIFAHFSIWQLRRQVIPGNDVQGAKITD
jgi:hypothetical protein